MKTFGFNNFSDLICLKPVLQVIAKSGDRIKIGDNILTIPSGYIWLERIDNEKYKIEENYRREKERQEDEIKWFKFYGDQTAEEQQKRRTHIKTKFERFIYFPSLRFPNQTSSHFGIVHTALCQKLESLHRYGSQEPYERPVSGIYNFYKGSELLIFSEPIRHSEEFAYMVPTFAPPIRFPQNTKKYDIGPAIESDEQTQVNEIEFKMKFIEELKSR